jgi:PiT family inorganic phosphate transporter
VDGIFRVLQLASAAVYSLSHGLNDAQKTMGIIALLLASVPGLAGYATHDGNPASTEMAWWIILSCHAAIALGTYAGGWKVIQTLGHRVTKLQPVGGFCAETGGGATILALSHFGIPVSTTHTITGAIFGVGMTHGFSSVRWTVGYRILAAWVLTLPAAAAMGAVAFRIILWVRHGLG